jgi:hypothetical protein
MLSRISTLVVTVATVVLATACSSTTASSPVAAFSQPAVPRWNTSDMNIMTNGNVAVATNLLNTGPAAGVPKALPLAEASKAPWKFFGDIYRWSGVAAIVQDYPPQNGSSYGEVVMYDPTGVSSVPVDFVVIPDSGLIHEGDKVTVSGYVVGQVDVKNKLGGTTSQLVMVGKSITKQKP